VTEAKASKEIQHEEKCRLGKRTNNAETKQKKGEKNPGQRLKWDPHVHSSDHERRCGYKRSKDKRTDRRGGGIESVAIVWMGLFNCVLAESMHCDLQKEGFVITERSRGRTDAPEKHQGGCKRKEVLRAARHCFPQARDGVSKGEIRKRGISPVP